jgi:hypothetical protein
MYAIRDAGGRVVGRAGSKVAAHRASRSRRFLGSSVNRVGGQPVVGYVVRAVKSGRYLVDDGSSFIPWFLSDRYYRETSRFKWVIDPDKATVFPTEKSARRFVFLKTEIVPVYARDYR